MEKDASPDITSLAKTAVKSLTENALSEWQFKHLPLGMLEDYEYFPNDIDTNTKHGYFLTLLNSISPKPLHAFKLSGLKSDGWAEGYDPYVLSFVSQSSYISGGNHLLFDEIVTRLSKYYGYKAIITRQVGRQLDYYHINLEKEWSPI